MYSSIGNVMAETGMINIQSVPFGSVAENAQSEEVP